MEKKVVLVNGPGRVGTSALTGVLSLVGLRVPRPHVLADKQTDQPSFESRWVVDHHQAMLRRDPVVRALDSRPEAPELADRLVVEEDAVELHVWLSGILQDAPTGQIALNDPRGFWFHDHWLAAAGRLGADVGSLTLLTHPVAFVRSRDLVRDDADRDPRLRRQRDTAFLAGWVHALLVVEESTRTTTRVVVRHADLVADWRTELSRVGDRLGLSLDLEAGSAPVAELLGSAPPVGPTDWDEVDVPDALRDVALGVWDQLGRLVADPDDASVPEALASLRLDYERVYDHAIGLTTDHLATREVLVSRRARAAAARDYESQIAELEQQLEEAHHSADDDIDDGPPVPRSRWRR